MQTDNNGKKTEFETVAWRVSFIISLFFVFILIVMFIYIDSRYIASIDQVASTKQIEEKIQQYKKQFPIKPASEIILIPTGVFIQSFEFLSSNTVRVSGYVWQKISKEALKKGISPGVIFPEANANVNIERAYEVDEGDLMVIGWHFYGLNIIQNFDYSSYPFEIQSIWIRLWPKDFYRNIILVPDLVSYDSTKPGDTFGLEADIVRHGFKFEETYFDMPTLYNDTNFGISGEAGRKTSLELFFNIIVKRNIIGAFLVHFLPILVIWSFLFAFTTIITNNPDLATKVGLSTTQLFIALGGTVFSVLLLNINLRNEFAGQAITYVEYFYLMTYVMIIVISYDAYIVTTRSRLGRAFKNNMVLKILFWPLILLSVLIFTYLKFFIFHDDFSHWYKVNDKMPKHGQVNQYFD